jgi:UDP-glucose 4-epimerase
MYEELEGKKVLITGGTGSLGKTMVNRLLYYSGAEKITIFSRDEAKQYYMRLEHQHKIAATEELIYKDHLQRLQFKIGDVRDYESVRAVVNDADFIVNAAAMKQVPICEYFPYEAVKTNITGAHNIVEAVKECGGEKTVVGVSTDKAPRAINAMGMTKALQERVFIEGNISAPNARFVCVRYGNVLASRGSVVPLFAEQILKGGPVTITSKEMTRFLLPLERAVDTVLFAIKNALMGETIIPIVPSAKIFNVASVMVEGKNVEIVEIGIRPGEKIHEILISPEETYRTYKKSSNYYAIKSMLPEICEQTNETELTNEYGSNDNVMSIDDTRDLLNKFGLLNFDIYGKMSSEVLK